MHDSPGSRDTGPLNPPSNHIIMAQSSDVPGDSGPASLDTAFSRPRPRPARSPSQTTKVRVQNRRREFLERNPGYFSSTEHEFADPDYYDTFVRRFQTPAEREAEGRARGWGKTLESSLMRGEARLDRLASSYTGDRPAPSGSSSSSSARRGTAGAGTNDNNFVLISSDLAEEKPKTKQEGRERWEEFLRERFVHGGDEEFDYSKVDGNEDLDSMENRDREEEWFDDEEPEWADDSDEGEELASDDDGTKGGGEKTRPKRERILVGETGIQDY